jgi:predicted cupin superfamily sugar epimerase
MIEPTVSILVDRLDLLPHPEGGYYKETYRSDLAQLPPNALGIKVERNLSSAIYFLLTKGSFLAFHRIKQDELWHHYLGDPIAVHTISPEGAYHKLLLGENLEKGEFPQHMAKGWHLVRFRVAGRIFVGGMYRCARV